MSQPHEQSPNPHVTVDVRRQQRSPYEVRPLDAVMRGWRWDAPESERPQYRRGVARPTSDEQKADAENEGASAAEVHIRAVGVALALSALAAPALLGLLAGWRTLTHTRRRAADRRIDMAVTMSEARQLGGGNQVVTAAVLWGLIPLTAQALLLRIPDWTAIRAALQALDWTAVGGLAQDGAAGLLAGPAAGILAVALSTTRVRNAVKTLRGRAHLRAELAASLDAALDLAAGTSHSHLAWKREGADAIVDLSRVPATATRVTKASIESDLTAQRSPWTVDELNYPTLRLRPTEPHDLERRRIAEASGGLLAGAHQDDEPTTLWQPPHAA